MRPLVYLTRTESFNAAHRLFNPAWSEQENRAFFGKCSGKNFHGHNYTLHVTVKGVVCPDTGLVINAKALSAIIQETVVDRLDHLNLNLDVPYFANVLPSVENIAVMIWDALKAHLRKSHPDVALHKVLLQETPTISAAYFGEQKEV